MMWPPWWTNRWQKSTWGVRLKERSIWQRQFASCLFIQREASTKQAINLLCDGLLGRPIDSALAGACERNSAAITCQICARSLLQMPLCPLFFAFSVQVLA
jgi:hypothetical protein